jgi:hypothetical protein
MTSLLRGLTTNHAETDPAGAAGPRGRTYAVPFEQVWTATLGLARRRRGWTVLLADDLEGLICAEARTPLRFVDDVEIRIGLDENAQTRVDLRSASRKGVGDLGKNARRIRRFLRALDRELRGRGRR